MGKLEDLLEKTGFLKPDDPDEIITEVEGRKKEKEPKLPKGKITSAGITTPNIPVIPNVPTGDKTAVNPSAVGETNIIEEAYSTLSPETNDVYLVEQLEANFGVLPETQRAEIIRNTLTTMGKDINTLLAGVETKMGAVQQTYKAFSEKIAGEKQKLTDSIADFEEKINICKQGKIDRENSLQAATVTVNAEIARLNKIYNILGGK